MAFAATIYGLGTGARGRLASRTVTHAGRANPSSSARSTRGPRDRDSNSPSRGRGRGGRGGGGRGGGERGRGSPGRGAAHAAPLRRGRRGQGADPETSAAYAELGFLDPVEAKRIRLEMQREARTQQGPIRDPDSDAAVGSAPTAHTGAGAVTEATRLFAEALQMDAPLYFDPTTEGSGGGDGGAQALPLRRSARANSAKRPEEHWSKGLAATALPPPPPPIPIVRPNDGDKGTFFSGDSWAGLGCEPAVVDALKQLGLPRPAHVQAEALRLQRTRPPHIAVADQAGSGKTLAYLLPLLLDLRAREAQLGRPATQPGSAGIIVLAPTNELAQQVHRVTKALSGAGVRFRSAILTGSQDDAERRKRSWRTQVETLQGGVDVLVSTPGRLLAHLNKGSFSLAATQAVVLDEVDVLAGEEGSYLETVAPLQAAASPGLQFWLVSATLPVHVFDQLQSLFPGLAAAFGPGLHKTAAGLVEELVDCSGGEEVSLESGQARKLDALDERLAAVRAARVLVFCNKIETCRLVENHLNRRASKPQAAAGPPEPRYEVRAFHEAVRQELRNAALDAFLAPVAPAAPPLVLVCTDRTSRGIDAVFCEHVVLFDFPRDPSEYVRRVGRTARGAGGRGVVSVLALGKQVALARDIIERNQKGAPVHRIPYV